MNFKRNDVQEFIEYELSCFDLNKWTSYKGKVLSWSVSERNMSRLKRCLKSDLNSYFFKALQTFCQAIHEIKQKKYAWPIIKLYYSTFYLLRCDILLANYFLVKCGGLYYSKINIGQKFTLFTKRNIRGDHRMTVSFANKLYDEGDISDPIFGNDIDGINAYLWLMKNRERVNYQMKSFTDPYSDIITSHLLSYFQEGKLIELFEFYNENRDYSICFDLDHAILSIPYKKLIQIYKKMGNNIDLSDEYKRKLISCFRLTSELNLERSYVEELVK